MSLTKQIPDRNLDQLTLGHKSFIKLRNRGAAVYIYNTDYCEFVNNISKCQDVITDAKLWKSLRLNTALFFKKKTDMTSLRYLAVIFKTYLLAKYMTNRTTMRSPNRPNINPNIVAVNKNILSQSINRGTSLMMHIVPMPMPGKINCKKWAAHH